MFWIEFGVWPQVFLLVLARVAGVVGTVPFFATSNVPKQVLAGMCVMFALLLTPLVPPEWFEVGMRMHEPWQIFIGMLGEVLLGVMVGSICAIFTSVFAIGGRIIAYSGGFMMARELNPHTGVQSTVMTNLLRTLFVLSVVLTNSHLLLLRMTAESFFHAPPQLAWFDSSMLQGFLAMGETIFDLGLRLAAPVMSAALIINVAMGVIAKFASEFNVLFLALPIRIGAVLTVLGLTLRFGPHMFSLVTEKMLQACSAVLLTG